MAKSISDPPSAWEVAVVRAASTTSVTVLVSAIGCQALGMAEEDLPEGSSFRSGAWCPAVIGTLCDPALSCWQLDYNQDRHALVMDTHDKRYTLAAEVRCIEERFTEQALVAHRGTAAGDVREHFVLRDSTGPPLFFVKDIDEAAAAARHTTQRRTQWAFLQTRPLS